MKNDDMNKETFNAIVVTEREGVFSRSVVRKRFDELPDHNTLVKVKYAALNYKDALSATGNKGVTKNYPHTPGIDASGIVVQANRAFREGDEVIVTGFDLGMNTSGSFAEYIRVPEAWVISKPENITLKESMILGTAGLTAGIGIEKMLRNEQTPDKGPILVTGASGGVGSLAVKLLSKLGFDVVASTGKKKAIEILKTIGADSFLDRREVDDVSGKLLLSPRWAGAFDTVGGNILATAIKACQPYGNVVSCGNIASSKIPISVFPFILNGVNLLGVDSAQCPADIRKKIWSKFSNEWKLADLEDLAIDCNLDDLDHYLEQILYGKIIGRVIVNFA